ncbi:MAG: hypothetical protein KIT09_01190 [Bryobacteraceae bacterium]|nr:hypothetical protein [Bryobacteraceae bacterium]
MKRQVSQAVASALTFALSLALCAPFAAVGFSIARAEEGACRMEACKRMKSCCCKTARSESRDAGAKWRAARLCPQGCSQMPSVKPPLPWTQWPAAVFQGPKQAGAPVAAVDLTGHRSSELEFALFERPPPAA